jgi:hypothetical protein
MVVLMPTISCLMGKSDIAVTDQFIEPCSLYSILVGFPSTKKSVCLNFIKNEYIIANNHVNSAKCEKGKFKACFANNSKLKLPEKLIFINVFIFKVLLWNHF